MAKSTPSKSIYFLMELMIVLIFFALSSAICLQLIMKAHEQSAHGEQLRFAMLEGGNVVETIQATHEVPDAYKIQKDGIVYEVSSLQTIDEDGITIGTIIIKQAGESLIELPFAFQEAL